MIKYFSPSSLVLIILQKETPALSLQEEQTKKEETKKAESLNMRLRRLQSLESLLQSR